MSDPTEQDLVEAMSPAEREMVDAMAEAMKSAAWDWRTAAAAELALAALRDALPEGVVLTRDGLARVTVAGVDYCTAHGDSFVDDERCGSALIFYADCGVPSPLYTLTRIEEQ